MSTEHQTREALETSDAVELVVWTRTTMLDDEDETPMETNVARGID